MKIMAVDFGDAHTGIAVSDPTELLASPFGIINEKELGAIVARTAETAKELGAGLVVVGNPINMNGSAGERSIKCNGFAQKLEKKIYKITKERIPVILWDERKTTFTAKLYAKENKTPRNSRPDAAAAAIILEGYLAYRKNTAQTGRDAIGK